MSAPSFHSAWRPAPRGSGGCPEWVGPQGCERQPQGVVRSVRPRRGEPRSKAGAVRDRRRKMSARLGQLLAVRDSRSDANVALAEAERDRCSPRLDRPCALLRADHNYITYRLNYSTSSVLAKVQKMAPNPLESFSGRPILPAAGIAREGAASGSPNRRAKSDANPAR